MNLTYISQDSSVQIIQCILKSCPDAPELISGCVNIELDVDISVQISLCVLKHCSDAPESISGLVNIELNHIIDITRFECRNSCLECTRIDIWACSKDDTPICQLGATL